MRITTKRGYDFAEVSSAMQKAIRRADTRLAGYWALELWHSVWDGFPEIHPTGNEARNDSILTVPSTRHMNMLLAARPDPGAYGGVAARSIFSSVLEREKVESFQLTQAVHRRSSAQRLAPNVRHCQVNANPGLPRLSREWTVQGINPTPSNERSPRKLSLKGAEGWATPGTRLLSSVFQMMRATPKIRDFAGRVIAFETKQNVSSDTTPVVFAVFEKLRPHWTNLMGNIGFRSLLARALTVATAEVPWLSAVQVGADGSLEALHKLETRMDPATMAAGSVILLVEFFSLLEALIGETLALSLMQDVWPKLLLDDSNSGLGK